jgi:hypothetical protein
MGHSEFDPAIRERRPWNAGRMVGAKRALKPQQVWAIRFWLDRERRLRDRALFDLAIDRKLRDCDVVKIRIGELVSGGRVRTRATVTQQKTGRPVQFELLEAARSSLQAWLEHRGGAPDDYAFPSRIDHSNHIGLRKYARLVDEWVTAIGLRREDYGMHSLRRTKASIIYKATGNLRAVQLSLAIPKSRARCAISGWTSKTRSLLLSRRRYDDGRSAGVSPVGRTRPIMVTPPQRPASPKRVSKGRILPTVPHSARSGLTTPHIVMLSLKVLIPGAPHADL